MVLVISPMSCYILTYWILAKDPYRTSLTVSYPILQCYMLQWLTRLFTTLYFYYVATIVETTMSLLNHTIYYSGLIYLHIYKTALKNFSVHLYLYLSFCFCNTWISPLGISKGLTYLISGHFYNLRWFCIVTFMLTVVVHELGLTYYLTKSDAIHKSSPLCCCKQMSLMEMCYAPKDRSDFTIFPQ